MPVCEMHDLDAEIGEMPDQPVKHPALNLLQCADGDIVGNDYPTIAVTARRPATASAMAARRRG